MQCTIKNGGDQPREILLADHHPFHGTLPYPVGMRATLWDERGNVIVKDCTWYVVWNTTFDEMPGDRIWLKPGDEVVRIVPLDKMVGWSLPSLKAGLYRVQLTLGEMTSNLLTLRIAN